MNKKNNNKKDRKIPVWRKLKILVYLVILIKPQLNFDVGCSAHSFCGVKLSIGVLVNNGDQFEQFSKVI